MNPIPPRADELLIVILCIGVVGITIGLIAERNPIARIRLCAAAAIALAPFFAATAFMPWLGHSQLVCGLTDITHCAGSSAPWAGAARGIQWAILVAATGITVAGAWLAARPGSKAAGLGFSAATAVTVAVATVIMIAAVGWALAELESGLVVYRSLDIVLVTEIGFVGAGIAAWRLGRLAPVPRAQVVGPRVQGDVGHRSGRAPT